MYRQTDFKNDEILVTGYSEGGSSLVEDDAYQSVQAISSVIRESGVSEFDAPQLNKKLTGKTVYVFPFIAERHEGFNGSCSPRDFEVLFQMLYLYATAPRMEESAVQAYLKKQYALRENLLSNPNNYFGDVVNRIRYQDHPRRRIPRPEDLEQVQLGQMKTVYRDRFADMSDFTFFFTGAFDPMELRALATRYLGNLPSIKREESWKNIGVRSPEGVVDTAFFKGEAPRTNVRVIYHGDFTWDSRKRFEFDAMIAYVRIKLRESLREDLGGVYGVSVGGYTARDPEQKYNIQISFNSDPPRTGELLTAAEEVLDGIKAGQIEEADVQKVKELQRQSRIKDLKENRFWHQRMIGSWLDGAPLEELTLEYLDEMLNTLTPDIIRAAANAYFGENKIQVVMHPEDGSRR
jgi:zinc protease